MGRGYEDNSQARNDENRFGIIRALVHSPHVRLPLTLGMPLLLVPPT